MSLHDVRKTAEEVISNHSRQSGAKNSNLNYEYSGKNSYEYYPQLIPISISFTRDWDIAYY